jgi:hypothetical protein
MSGLKSISLENAKDPNYLASNGFPPGQQVLVENTNGDNKLGRVTSKYSVSFKPKSLAHKSSAHKSVRRGGKGRKTHKKRKTHRRRKAHTRRR